jgi:hypothetical protein
MLQAQSANRIWGILRGAPFFSGGEMEPTLNELQQYWLNQAEQDRKWRDDVIEEQEKELEILQENCEILTRRLQETEKIYNAVVFGQILRKQKEEEQKRFKKCNHRKGGECEFIKGFTGRIGAGSADDYAIMKHQMFWKDVWVRCLRCGHWWKPGDSDYEEALNFPTTNSMSTSSLWNVDVDLVRELTRGT